MPSQQGNSQSLSVLWGVEGGAFPKLRAIAMSCTALDCVHHRGTVFHMLPGTAHIGQCLFAPNCICMLAGPGWNNNLTSERAHLGEHSSPSARSPSRG